LVGDVLPLQFSGLVWKDGLPFVLCSLLTLMETARTSFKTANYLFRKADHARWHRQQSKEQILRSQLGFKDLPLNRPKACQGCIHYHGVAYGYSRATRSLLVCAFHPYGWQDEVCPDWCGT
jgi:hypothetical protein